MLFRLVPLNQLQSVEDYLAGHHAGDVGPPPAWGGEGDDVYGPCAIAGDCLPFSGPPLGRGLRGADAHRRPAGQETQLCQWARGATAPASVFRSGVFAFLSTRPPLCGEGRGLT